MTMLWAWPGVDRGYLRRAQPALVCGEVPYYGIVWD